MDFVTLLWNVFSFLLNFVWSVAWFLLRDLISALLWLIVVAWLILSVRYRSFVAATAAILRYGGYGLRLFWRWLGGSQARLHSPAKTDRRERMRARRRAPLGTMSISEQLNMILVGAIYLMLLT